MAAVLDGSLWTRKLRDHVSQYRTNVQCRPAGRIQDVFMVVSMRPIRVHDLKRVCKMTLWVS